MHRVLVESSAITAIGYDSDALQLEVEFRSGAVYQYYGVPPEIHAALLRSESKGRYLNAKIRNRFEYSLVQDPET
jgi:KTSC domain